MAITINKAKATLDDSMMDCVSGGCGQCESANSYKRFMIAAAIAAGYRPDLKNLDFLIRAYLAAFDSNATTGCTDEDFPGSGAVINPAYNHV